MNEPKYVKLDPLQRFLQLRKTDTTLFWFIIIITIGFIFLILGILIAIIWVFKKKRDETRPAREELKEIREIRDSDIKKGRLEKYFEEYGKYKLTKKELWKIKQLKITRDVKVIEDEKREVEKVAEVAEKVAKKAAKKAKKAAKKAKKDKKKAKLAKKAAEIAGEVAEVKVEQVLEEEEEEGEVEEESEAKRAKEPKKLKKLKKHIGS